MGKGVVPYKPKEPVKATKQTINDGTFQKDQERIKQEAAARSDAQTQKSGDKKPAGIDMSTATALVSKPFPKFSLRSFPSDIDQQRNFKLFYYDYSRTTFEQSATLTGKECIILPLPSNLVEKTAPSWDAKALGVLGAAAMSGINKFMDGAGSTPGNLRAKTMAGTKSLKEWAGQAIASPEALLALASIGAKAANETAGNLLDMATGTTPNPHLTMLFKGVNLRQHQFRWKFAPESAEESKSLRDIITTLKAISLPNKGQFLLGYPGIVQPKIEINGTGGYTELYSMKECVIMGVDVNYAPSGVPAFFAGTGAPVEVELTLSLQEVRIVTRNDYETEMNNIVSDPPGVDDPSGE